MTCRLSLSLGQGSCFVCTAVSTAGSQATNGLHGYIYTIVLAQTSILHLSPNFPTINTAYTELYTLASQEHEVSSHLM